VTSPPEPDPVEEHADELPDDPSVYADPAEFPPAEEQEEGTG
jgi:hypothetical protein